MLLLSINKFSILDDDEPEELKDESETEEIKDESEPEPEELKDESDDEDEDEDLSDAEPSITKATLRARAKNTIKDKALQHRQLVRQISRIIRKTENDDELTRGMFYANKKKFAKIELFSFFLDRMTPIRVCL